MRIVKDLLNLTKKVQETTVKELLLPQEIAPSESYPILPYTLFKNTRGYLEKINHQINKCYRESCYDACAVMIRRLIEVLIIEVFDHFGLVKKIQNQDGDFFSFENLISKMLAESSWSLGKITKKAFQQKQFKAIGDLSAHGRRYNTRRDYLGERIIDLRVVVEDLLYLADLKK